MLSRDKLEEEDEVIDDNITLVTADSRLVVVCRDDTVTDGSGGSALRELPLPSSTVLVDTITTELLPRTVAPILASVETLIEPKIIDEVTLLNAVSSIELGSKRKRVAVVGEIFSAGLVVVGMLGCCVIGCTLDRVRTGLGSGEELLAIGMSEKPDPLSELTNMEAVLLTSVEVNISPLDRG